MGEGAGTFLLRTRQTFHAKRGMFLLCMFVTAEAEGAEPEDETKGGDGDEPPEIERAADGREELGGILWGK